MEKRKIHDSPKGISVKRKENSFIQSLNLARQVYILTSITVTP